jgi:hypothetical protein
MDSEMGGCFQRTSKDLSNGAFKKLCVYRVGQ